MSTTIQRGHAGSPEAGAERGQVPERAPTSNATAMVVSPQIADIGFAVAAGVLISAFINALLLVPALTALAGRAAWWPAAQATAH